MREQPHPGRTWFDRDVVVSAEELAREQLSDAQFRSAALLLHTRGYVVLRQAIPVALVREARAAFEDVFRDCLESRQGEAWYQVARRTQAVFWERGARWRIFPKLRPPLNSPWLLANPLALALLTDVLGPDCYCKFVSSDTCVKGSELQSPHRELGAGRTREPCGYVVNIPLVFCGRHNGPLEIWPGGTHHWHSELLERFALDTDVQDGRNPEMEAFVADWPSVKVELHPGDVLIRDPGLLHRGTPNPTQEPRTLLTLCYFRRGHTWDYGRTEYGLDATLYAQLEPRVRRLFDDAFDRKAG